MAIPTVCQCLRCEIKFQSEQGFTEYMLAMVPVPNHCETSQSHIILKEEILQLNQLKINKRPFHHFFSEF